MREIKFRAWVNMATKEGEEDFVMIPWSTDFFSDSSPVTRYDSDFPDKDDPEIILMQFTGLTDKNGKEIYEGDILEDGKKQVGMVFWHNAAFRVEWEMRDSEGRRDVYEIDSCFGYGHVIGNIYENPELLVNKKK